jgi:phosphoserine phosphatase
MRRNVLIAFDVDGTLRDNTRQGSPLIDQDNGFTGEYGPVANERIRELLITLASFKNTEIMVWSGGGELYCRQIVSAFGLRSYVDIYADKRVVNCQDATDCDLHEPDPSHWHFAYDGPRPDIAIDDIQSFSLGAVNLIVREK